MAELIQDLASGPVASAAPTAAKKSPSGLTILARRCGRVLLARKKMVLVCLVISAVVSVGVAVPLTKYSWESTAVILHTPLPVSENQRSLYSAPNLQTQLSLVKSPDLFEELAKEFHINAPPKMFDKVFKVELTKSTETIIVSLKWDKGEEGAALVNRLVELFIEKAAKTRRKRLMANSADMELEVQTCKEKLRTAGEALRTFQLTEKSLDARGGLEHLNIDIQALENNLETAKRNKLNIIAQIVKLDKHIEELKNHEGKEDTQTFGAAEETVADNRRRQDRLRELIEDERKAIELQPILEAKRKELDRVKDLYSHHAATLTQLNQLEGEVGALLAKLKDTDKIKQWKEELEKIDKVVVPKGPKKSGSPIIMQTLTRRLELDLQKTSAEEDIRQIEQNLDEKRKGINAATAMQRRAEVLLKDIERLETERQRLEGILATLHQLQGKNTCEFIVVSEAKKADNPVSSNRKIILVSVLFPSLLFGLGCILAFDLRKCPPTAQEVAQMLGLNVLGRVSGSDPADQSGMDPAQRQLALRVRQQMSEPGAMFLVTSLRETGGLDTVSMKLAKQFAVRDERVLILDTRLRRGGAPRAVLQPVTSAITGLSEFLTFQCLELSEVIHPTADPGVDVLPAGAPAHPDRVATHRMRELLDQIRETYTLTILLGPPLGEMVDLEILAAHAQGIAVAIDDAEVDVSQSRITLRSLTELKAPLFGAILSGSD